MINRESFITKFCDKIAYAKSIQENPANALDMRLYIDSDFNGDIYEINLKSILDLFEKVKNEKREWYVDFYENYAEINTAEFIDVAIFSDEFPQEKALYFMSVHKLNEDESHYELSDEEFIKRSEFCYTRIEDFCYDFNDEAAPSDCVYYSRYC